ncbi:MAG TPA: four helix bundle protein [Xanthomonadaceae bacterium]|nr:four helix bundle protein [Xanthomonadaceae bacterium]
MGNRKANTPLHYDLDVWKDAMRLARGIYRVSAAFPETERYGLATQIRRAAVSVASNIAEGAGRGSRLEYARHLRIARGSLMELDTQLWIARDLEFASDIDDLQALIQRVAAMLNALIASKTRPPSETPA